MSHPRSVTVAWTGCGAAMDARLHPAARDVADPDAVRRAGAVSVPSPTPGDQGTALRTLAGARPRARIADAIEQVRAGAAEESP